MAVGLRERKKESVREVIAEAAMVLFDEHGFDAVAVADVAAKAGVSTKTVFNYFAVKEDLVLASRQRHERALLSAIRERPSGVGALEVTRLCALAVLSELEKLPHGRRARFHRVLARSPSIAQRLRARSTQTEWELGWHLAADIGAPASDPRPAIAAAALMSLWYLAFSLAGEAAPGPAEHIDLAAAFLTQGLGDYGMR